jgi:AcrR family transcriptional regulator
MALEKEDSALFFKLFEQKPRKGDIKKFEIVDAAIRCVADEGIRGLTYDAIGKRLRIGRSHVLYHFSSIDLILDASIKFITATAQSITVEEIKKAKSPKQQIEAFVNGAFFWAERHPEQVAVLLLFYHFCATQPQYKGLHSEIRKVGQQRLATMILTGFKDEISDRGKIERIAEMAQGLITGNLLGILTTTQKQDHINEVRIHTAKIILEMIVGK